MIFDSKRDEFEIIHELLILAEEGIKKTPLMYKANLSHTHFMTYVDFLLERGFLDAGYDNPSSGDIYHTTQKGKHFLDSISTVLNQVD